MDEKKPTKPARVEPAFVELTLEMALLDGSRSESDADRLRSMSSIIEEAARLQSTLFD